jgi:hypothetical protein
VTINEAEDIAASCKRDARINPNGPLLAKAAEAIEFLLWELEQAETYYNAGDFYGD